MKTSITFFVLFVLFNNTILSQEPTNAGIPDASRVLVVYNSNSMVSDSVMQYYVAARGIPHPQNVVGLPLTRRDITINGVTHPVIIAQETDIIRDSINHQLNNGTKSFHAWRYYLDYVATPIRDWITAHNLTSTIRYIVLCKGVPFKIQANADGSDDPGNLTVDGLLCILNTENYDSLITNEVYPIGIISNPYNDVDQNYTMEYRFLPDHFTTSWHGYTVKLSYLVSHLDGISYDVVKGIIDRSIEPDMSGTAAWIIDDDLTWSGGHFADARDKLEELGFNVFYDHSDTWITSYPEIVIGFTSWGTHAEDGNCEWEDSAWVKDSLHFDLANGSVFNTYESFNGNSLTTLNWRYVTRPNPNCHHTQGLATQFTEIGGTGTMGHAWEPGGGGIIENQIFFPAYQMGYNLVDAFYQGLPHLAWENVLVGDPLVRIYECENTIISTNTIIGSGDYDCDVIVPLNVKLTVASGSVVNFKRNAKLKVYGTLELRDGATLNFNKYSRLYLEGNFTMDGTSAYLNFNDNSVFKTLNISLDNFLTVILNDYSKFYVQEDGSLITHPDNSFIFNSHSKFYVDGNIIVNEGNSLNFNDFSTIDVNNKILFNAGAEISFNEKSYINVYGSFLSLGQSAENKVTFNFSGAPESKCQIYNADTVLVSYSTFNNSGLSISTDQDFTQKLVSIINSIFNSAKNPLYLAFKNAIIEEPVIISGCEINNCTGTGISIFQAPDIILEYDTVHLLKALLPVKGIVLKNNGMVDINSCIIIEGEVGIESKVSTNDDLEIIEDLETDISISQCVFEDCTIGILIDNQIAPYEAVEIHANHFSGCTYGIDVNDFLTYTPFISENIISRNNYESVEYGLLLTNGNEVVVSNNSITNYYTGINLNLVNTPHIINNFISAEEVTVDRGKGIVSVSSDGEIRKNLIEHHLSGIELGSSSPNLAENIITDNDYYGVYISEGSFPNLSKTIIGPSNYPLTGYNIIRENGICNDNAEIYFNKTSANLHLGCNTIADDRENSGGCDYTLLMDGFSDEQIDARGNYWGDHPVYGHNPGERFGHEISVLYNPFLDEPCTFSPSEDFIILATKEGNTIDTIRSSGIAPNGLTDLQSRYRDASEYYYNNQYSQAKLEYEGIIQNYGNDKGSLQAYNRLYSIANLMNSAPETFNNLKVFYLDKAGNQSDSLMIGALTHLSDLCLVSAEEYILAINNFDQIAQQNPNTDIAFYSQIDALTAALLIPSDSTMNKGVLGKYCVNDLSDYTNKLTQLLKTRGRDGLESEKDLIPTEYTLYQNYPNPFNPVTTIKYDLPNASEVSLIIYDILGRRVKQLVNDKQQPGRYEIKFDASNLASGVYIYQFIAEKYINAKKMILLK